ncbi:MAG: hypothetical protein SGJ18_04590 [Pseudomonadota bacterium]|nr:hypothetical protein [Pseudomonadota bacterium]
MEMILDLLERKNMFLEKFTTINEAELLNIEARDFGNLESFYDCRENLLKLMSRLDEQIEHFCRTIDGTASKENKIKVTNLLDRKDLLVKKIVDQDLCIITCIEKEKSGIIAELKAVQTSRKLMETYEKPGVEGKSKLNEKV